ncbi:ADP-ribosylglycohydrolase family protein [Gordonia soli]|uniref:Putative hydrolase n=1 Tax=Gordonia soli NBRC 108243 TaxID=1223545 RepID=M0QP46_9ACTN|nr:ADP-ribosylglycohydrolase family protein [Gordonia soli]GAC69217.1 putative hydrolase [Gordonia soli NBRC 108243]
MTRLRLTNAQMDRAAGVVLGTAVGDALGVPYEFDSIPMPADGERARMLGGGLGNFAPGEWSDDTSMAMAIADVAATGAVLTAADSLDAIADNFMRWFDGDPDDVGIQTRAVLSATRRRLRSGEGGIGRVMRDEAARYAASHPHSAGNGALMRTAPVALAHLGDRGRLADAARLVASLTHADPLAGDSCVLWCEAIRVAVLDGRFDVRAGLDLIPADRVDQWDSWLDSAAHDDPKSFSPNGFTVTALQAAASAVLQTPAPTGAECRHFQDALHAAVRIGNDTDTVAAIAGGLLGARWGAGSVPWFWRRAVHGWPKRDGRFSDAHDLVGLATLAARGGNPDAKGWPTVDEVGYSERASRDVIPHPFDAGVLLGTHATVEHAADAVVSMCRVGRTQSCFAGATDVVASRLMDSDDPADNPHLDFVMADTADAVRGLRAEGKTVLLHCVAGHQRTPSVAVAYGVLLGHPVNEVREAILAVIPDARGRGVVWDAAGGVSHAL